MRAHAVVDQPGARAQRAQLLGIGLSARVARATTIEDRRERLVDREHPAQLRSRGAAGDDVAVAAKRLARRPRRGRRAGRRRRARADAGGTPAASPRRSCRRRRAAPRAARRSRPRSARTTVPSGVTTSAPTRLSQVRPCWAVRWPIPPPKVSPATPVEPTTPPGVTRPNAWVAVSKSSQVAPPSARAIRASASTSTLRISERSITSPPSQTQWPAGLCPPPRTATSSPCARAKSNAVADVARRRGSATITAGRRSTRALKQRRTSS